MPLLSSFLIITTIPYHIHHAKVTKDSHLILSEPLHSPKTAHLDALQHSEGTQCILQPSGSSRLDQRHIQAQLHSQQINQSTPDSPSTSFKRKAPSNTEELDRLLAEWVNSQPSRGVIGQWSSDQAARPDPPIQAQHQPSGLVDWGGEETVAEGDGALDQQLEVSIRQLTEVTIQDVVQPAGEEGEEEEEDDTGLEEAGDFDTPTPPASPERRPAATEEPQRGLEEQIRVLKLAQDIFTDQGLLTPDLLDAFALCTVRLSQSQC